METKNDQEQDTRYHECNLDCTLNEWFEGQCFKLFVAKFKINLQVHKYGFGGCRRISADTEQDYATIHLYYNTGYYLVLPPVTGFPNMQSISLVSNREMSPPTPIRTPTPPLRHYGSFSSPFPNVPSLESSLDLPSPESIRNILCPVNDDENVLRDLEYEGIL